MRRSFVWLLFSVALNALLACMLLQQHTPSPGPQSSLTASDQTSVSEKRIRIPAQGVAPGSAVSIATWETIYSEDPREFASRLRGAGCPEFTVRAIISARLNSMRKEQIAAIRPAPFFSTPAERRSASLRVFRERQEITSRTDALARELTGLRWIEERPRQASEYLLMEALLQFLTGRRSNEGWEDLVALMERCDRSCDNLSELPPMARLRETERLWGWYQQSLAQVLNTSEQRDFAQRMAAWIIFQETDSDFEFEAAELQSVSARLLDVVPELQVPAFEASELKIKSNALENGFEAAVREILQPDRLAEWQMQRDDDYQFIRGQLENSQLSIEAAEACYHAKRKADEDWIQSIQNGSQEQEEEIAAIRRTASETIRAALPKAVWEELLKRRPYWMDTVEGVN